MIDGRFEGELHAKATNKETLSVRREGKRDVQRTLDFYNLDANISVGHRIKSRTATHCGTGSLHAVCRDDPKVSPVVTQMLALRPVHLWPIRACRKPSSKTLNGVERNASRGQA